MGAKENLTLLKRRKKFTAKQGIKFHILLSLLSVGLVLRMSYVHTIKLHCIGVPTCIIHAACENKGFKIQDSKNVYSS